MSALDAAGFAGPAPTYRVEMGAPLAGTPEPVRRPPAPTAPAAETPLPEAASPEVAEQATEEAVDREREATDGSTNLLSEERSAE